MEKRRRVITRPRRSRGTSPFASACKAVVGYMGAYALGVSLLGALGAPAVAAPWMSGLASAAGLGLWMRKRQLESGPSPALLKAVDRVSRDMEGVRDPDQLCHLVVSALTKALKPSRLFIWLPSRDRASFYLAAGTGAFPRTRELPEDWIQEFFEYLSSDVLNPVDLPPDGSKFSRWLTSCRLSLCLPIVSHGRLIGLLTCGEKADGKTYTGSDRWLMNQMLRQSALALSYMGLLHEKRRAKNDMDNLVTLYKDAQQRAITDGLTGLMTHLYFQEQLAQRFSEARRYQAPLALLLIDVDHFKQFNDRYGHQAGDEVLRQVARVVRDEARTCDTVARYGGEELAVVLPQTDGPGAVTLAERIRVAIEALEVVDPLGRRLPVVTASLGVAELALSDQQPADMVERADRALYAAKRGGRNRVVTDDPGYGQAWAG